jgi:ADP-heptose:LPS heptosyltransferase
MNGLEWFMNVGEKPEASHKLAVKCFCFEKDQTRLFSAFYTKFNINLTKENDLHWFEFLALLNDLDKTAFRNVVNLRTLTEADMRERRYSAKQKAEIRKQKREFALEHIKPEITEKEEKAIEEFNKNLREF